MPQDILADGFVQLCVDTSLNFFEGKCRVLVEGQYDSAITATVADKLIAVPTSRDISAMFGVGSQLTEALEAMFCQCPNNIELFAIPRADPVGGTVAAYTITITGTATSDGRMDFFIFDGKYPIDFAVAEGETATQIATKLAAAIPVDFPFTAVAAAGVVTLTARAGVKGIAGNNLGIKYGWMGRTGYNPAGVTVAVAQSVVAAGAPEPLNYTDVLGSCCYSCFALLNLDPAAQNAWQAYIESQWACDKPQCFGHGYTAVPGTLGQILAQDTNAEVLSKMAHGLTDVSSPWLKVASYAALSCCTACDNPELSIQGRNYGVLSCVLMPESCTQAFTFAEQEQLKESGFVVTGPLSGGSGALTSPYVFNDITNNRYDKLGRPNATFRDVNSRRLTAATAVQIATKLQEFSGLGLFTKNTSIKQGVFGTNPRLILAAIRTWAKAQIGTLFSEFDNIDTDIQVLTDAQVMPKCTSNPNKLHLLFKYRPPVRIGKIATILQPKLLDNCDR